MHVKDETFALWVQQILRATIEAKTIYTNIFVIQEQLLSC